MPLPSIKDIGTVIANSALLQENAILKALVRTLEAEREAYRALQYYKLEEV